MTGRSIIARLRDFAFFLRHGFGLRMSWRLSDYTGKQP